MKLSTKVTVAGVAAVASVAAFGAGSASALTISNWNGDSTVKINREITGVSNPVTNTFGYTITQASTDPSGMTATNLPANPSVVFNNTGVTSNKATSYITYDLSNVNFSDIGDYYFTVVESSSTSEANYPRSTDKTYQFIVSVRNNMSNRVPDGTYNATIVYRRSNAGGTWDKLTRDTFTWTSQAVRTKIQLDQVVKGNMAKKTDCFKYTISIPTPSDSSIALANDTYKITTNSSSCSGQSDANVKVGGSATVYMQHGDTVSVGSNGTLNEMPIGLPYTITVADKKGYDSTFFDSSTTDASSVTKTTVATTASTYNANNVTTITNNKDRDPATGVLMNIWPFVLLTLLAGAGTFFFVAKKKSSNEQK